MHIRDDYDPKWLKYIWGARVFLNVHPYCWLGTLAAIGFIIAAMMHWI